MNDRAAGTSPDRAERDVPSAAILPRPRLDERMQDALDRRLTTVVAGAGYGKSTLIATWASTLHDVDVAWCQLDIHATELRVLVERTAQAIERTVGLGVGLDAALDRATTDDAADASARAEGFAALLDQALETGLERPFILVFDDLHELGSSEPALRFIESLMRGAPPDLHLVLISRDAIPFQLGRARARGQVLDIASEQLLFDHEELAALLGRAGIHDPGLADDVGRLTGGWPALTRLVLETIRPARPGDRRATLDRMREPRGPLLSYVAQEVIGRESAATLEVLRVAAHFETVSPDLLSAAGVADAASVLADLSRRALFVEERLESGQPSFTLHTVVRDYALADLAMTEEQVQRIHRRVADRLDGQGRPADALRQRLQGGDHAGIVESLDRYGHDLVRSGDLDVVVEAVRSVPIEVRTAPLEVLLGDALLRRGEWAPALDALRRATPERGPLPAAVAWRMGLIEHERGDVDTALATFARSDLGSGDDGDRAQVAAWRTIAHWQREEIDEAREWSARAMEIAERSDDDRALAAAFAAVGAVAHMDGDANKAIESFRRSIDRAQHAGDAMLEARFRSDLSYNLVFQGRYSEALAEADIAVAKGGALGHSTFLALALTDRAQSHLGLGHLEEAAADLEAARRLYTILRSPWVAYPTLKQANVHRMRGEVALARAAYLDVIAGSQPLAGPWFLPEAVLGLAATTALDDPAEALRLVESAIDATSSVTAAPAPLGAAQVCLTIGRLDLAAMYASRARAIAEVRGDRPSLAAALEVQAEIEPDPALARDLLHEAEAIRMEIGSPLGSAHHEMVWAKIVGGSDGRIAALRAADTFRRIGARRAAERAAELAERIQAEDRPPAEIRSLGTFQVLRAGQPVPPGEWRSKKARDALKILVARRGRPVTREQLCDLLWPDEDPGPLLNRLSVALATIRAVLDPDKRFAPDYFIVGDRTTVALDLRHVAVDLEAFLDAADGTRRFMSPASLERRTALAAIEATYGGEFLEEDPYEDWAEPIRDEARAAYVTVARTLARSAAEAGEADDAVRLYLRILERDPFDEEAHLGLVDVQARAGRHGEARRRYQVYVSRMAELDLEAAPYPNVAGRPAA